MGNFHSQISGFVHKAAPLPGIAWAPVRVLSTVHWYWRWYYKKNLYADPENWISLAAGNLTNALYGDGWLRTLAHIILITHRTKQYMYEIHILYERGRDLKTAFLGVYTVPVKRTWDIPSGPSMLPRLAWKYAQEKACEYRHQIAIISVVFFRLMKQLFLVAMHAVEIYDAFYRREDAFNEVFVNIGDCANGFVHGGTSFHDYLFCNRETVQLVLNKLCIDIRVESILDQLRFSLSYVERTKSTIRSINVKLVKVFS